jgi:glycyl-tRNA synthetase beta chain
MKREDRPLLILEIGTEEIPARFVPLGMAKLKEGAERLLSEYRLIHGELKTYGTPRRLALITDIEPLGQASEKEVWGPPVHVAFDSSGNPTKAAEAFAKNSGIRVEDLQRKEKNKGLYVTAVIRESAMSAQEILPEVLPKLVSSLSFPKSMRWGSGTLRFVRPIHWILALYNNRKVPFEIGGIKSGNMTRGHRFLSPAAFEIKEDRAYINLLRNNLVILDRAERRQVILDSISRLADSVNASFVRDEELIEHVTDLVEYPQAFLGSFSMHYLDLPEELLTTVMRGHQRYIALTDGNGRLTNHFIVISNTRAENMDTVVKGAQKVLKARFEDARFYYEEDRKVPLLNRLEALKRVVYHERLGSIYDKVQRIEGLARYIAEVCYPHKTEQATLTARLCKTDLTTGVVREFPELQGIMGSYYARYEGYPEEVAVAIKDHYQPRFAGDSLPESEIAVVVSLADKVDNLVSFFVIGEIPSSTEDPFALRRQCYGVVTMLIEKGLPLATGQVVDKAFEGLSNNLRDLDKSGIKEEIIGFVGQRFEFYMQNKGYEQDIINSLNDFIGHIPLYKVLQRADALKAFKQKLYYQPLLLALKRVTNIAPKGPTGPVNPTLFEETQERVLFETSISCKTDVEKLVSEGLFAEALERLNGLQSPINEFFDKVLVMDNREDIRANRLSLVKFVQSIGGLIADLSKLS